MPWPGHRQTVLRASRFDGQQTRPCGSDQHLRRPKPRVMVTIGEKKQNRFGAATMLDFNIGLAVGNSKLTEEEWRMIMASDNGLAYLKGQWVEIDRERLSEALEHWKQV
ncbi:MAG TPA: hypothetical protein EYP56_19050, partial [Planctomycetaceae bacterium]|nr:hypothetical protein [Planctomycetaceae bacterium]